MKLLLFTQVVDTEDPYLSFFHGWIIELSKHFEAVTVICLCRGRYDLPGNVRVLSLGKESGQSRFKYLGLFYKYIFSERNNYDAVFVHMNQEYVILGGLLWKMWGKRIYMWRNHYAGSFLTDIAASLCHKVFCTSKYSYTAKYGKTVFMPVGIDLDFFSPQAGGKRIMNSILFLGRIAPSKKPDLLISALGELKRDGIGFSAAIYGDVLPKDAAYLESLKKRVADLGLRDEVKFYPGVPNVDVPEIYSAFDIFVNLTKSGSLDKTMFEAIGCGMLLIASNKDLAQKIDGRCIFEEGDIDSLTRRLTGLIRLTRDERAGISENLMRFAKTQSLRELALRISQEISR